MKIWVEYFVQYTGSLFTAVIKIKSAKIVWIWPNAWKN